MSFKLTSHQELSHQFRLGLSGLAWDIIHHDSTVFGNGCDPGNLINDVLVNYIPRARASISRVLNHENSNLENSLMGVQNASDICRKILDRRAQQLREQLPEYEQEDSKVFRVRDEVMAMLTANQCTENLHYGNGKASRYLRAVIEEYVRLPYHEREIVYFNKKVRVIEDAVGKFILEVETASGTSYAVIPHSIELGAMGNANYLVCFSQRFDDFNNKTSNMEPGCFRISRIKSIDSTDHRAKLTSEQKKTLEKKIKDRGVEFLTFEESKVVVRLTEAGQRKYRELCHLRPPYIMAKGDIYTFNCTMNQAEFFFFKFGKDAEILEPKELREKFAQMYREANTIYRGSEG